VCTDMVLVWNDVRSATAADLGLSHKDIHEARAVRDAEEAGAGQLTMIYPPLRMRAFRPFASNRRGRRTVEVRNPVIAARRLNGECDGERRRFLLRSAHLLSSCAMGVCAHRDADARRGCAGSPLAVTAAAQAGGQSRRRRPLVSLALTSKPSEAVVSPRAGSCPGDRPRGCAAGHEGTITSELPQIKEEPVVHLRAAAMPPPPNPPISLPPRSQPNQAQR